MRRKTWSTKSAQSSPGGAGRRSRVAVDVGAGSRAGDQDDGGDRGQREPRRRSAAGVRNWRQVSQIIAAPPGVGGRGAARLRALAHVGQHEVLEAELARPSRPGRGSGASVRTSSVVCRSVWLAETTCWSAGQRGRVAARPGEPVVGGEQRRRRRRRPDPGVDQHDQVVADPLEVGDQVRGQHDAELVLGDGLHQVLQELAPGQRVEARDRLVEDQQLGPLGEAEGQRELGALAAGELAGLLARVEAEPLDPARGQRVVPARVEPGARAAGGRRRVSPAYVGVSWATKPTLASCAGPAAGRPPSTSIVPRSARAARRPG